MKTELAPTSSDLSLLPRADLPVIWDGFRAKAEELRTTAETLTVTSVEQKAEMGLARTTRLTLKQIRVEVEKKRVELGEGHLTEIQKINGAAKKIKEMIEPLEARLLHQEQFAERVEADRVLELTKHRNDEIRSVRPGVFCPDVGSMKQADYDGYIARLRAEAAEISEAKRKQIEAEAKLAEQAKALRAAVAEAEARLAEEQAAQRKLRDEQAQAFLAQQAEAQRQAREVEARFAAERAEAEEKFRQEQAEKDRRRDEELKAVEAKRLELEVQLANERAAKQAEEERLRKLAVAPDLVKLRAYYDDLKDVPLPNLSTQDAERALIEAVKHVSLARTSLDIFCKRFEQA